MSVRAYRMRRAGTEHESWVALCTRHVEARRVLGYEVTERPDAHPLGNCDDCQDRGSVLEATIAAADALAAKDEPEPVRVLPGQRSLFGGDEP